ncbi:DUF4352 domain-containing protein [Nocardiopsis nanhaiensis]
MGAATLVVGAVIAFSLFDVSFDRGPVAGVGETFEVNDRLVTVLDVETGIEQVSDEGNHNTAEPVHEFVALEIHIEYIGNRSSVDWMSQETALYSGSDTQVADKDIDATLWGNPREGPDDPPFRLQPGEEGTLRLFYDVADTSAMNYLRFGSRANTGDEVLIDLNGPIHD